MKKYNYLWIILILMTESVFAKPTHLSFVTSTKCQKLLNNSNPFILVLKSGENLINSITNCATAAKIPSASLSGLGTLVDPTISYFLNDQKKYHPKHFPGLYEIVSIAGNITQVEGKPFVHIHAALSDSNYQTLGGHLNEATVGATTEITIIPFKTAIKRAPITESGTVGLIELKD